MMSSNDTLYELALEAINRLFYDRSVDKSVTAENLHSLMDELVIMIESLRD